MNIKQLASTQKGKLILCLSFLALVWVIILLNWLLSSLGELPNQAKIAKIKSELVKVKRENAKAVAEQKAMQEVRRNYRARAAESWIASHDGVIETGLRRRVSDVAQKMDFKLNNIGSVRTARINHEFSYADIDISGNGDFDDVIRLLAGVAKIQPRLAWRRLDMRPDDRYRRNTSSGSANLAAQVNVIPETRLNFSGTLRVFCYDGPLSVKDLKVTRPAAAVNTQEVAL